MRLTDFMEKADNQAKQLEMIGFKGSVLFTSMQQFIDKMIFKLTTEEMTENEAKVAKALHDQKAFEVALNKYRELKALGDVDPVKLADEIIKNI